MVEINRRTSKEGLLDSPQGPITLSMPLIQPATRKLARKLGQAGALIVVVALIAFGMAAQTARAADPDAPAGAPPTWLPHQPWVMDHWLPYAETTLYRTLGMSRDQVLQWLKAHDDHASLLELARQRGVPTTGLAARLVGRRQPGVSRAQYRLLLAHAQTTLTQPHLAHHMLGHLMHVLPLLKAMPAIFGYQGLNQVIVLRDQGMSYWQIGSRRGVTEAALWRRIMKVLTATDHQGLKLGQMPIPQASSWLARQRDNLTRWLTFVPPARASKAIATSSSGQISAAQLGPEYLCHVLL